MADRELYWGDSADSATTYLSRDDDPTGGGDFVFLRNTSTSTNIFIYDTSADELVAAKSIRIDGNLAATEATNVEAFATAGASGTVPVSQGDGTLAMEAISTGIELVEVQDHTELYNKYPPEELTKPHIAYLNEEDDYVGVFQG